MKNIFITTLLIATMTIGTIPAIAAETLTTNSVTTDVSEESDTKEIHFNIETDAANKIITNFQVSNDTTKSDILNAVKNSVDSSVNVTIQAFKKIKATESSSGKIKGILVIQDYIGNYKEITVSIIIEQLVDIKSDLKIETSKFNSEIDKVNAELKNIKVSNHTTEEDVIKVVKNSVDSSINIEFGIDEGQAFNIVKSTTEATGAITGTLIIKDDLGDSKEILVKLTIAQLENSDTLGQNITTNAAVTVNTNKVTKLDVKIEGNVVIGETVIVKTIGYNTYNENVDIDTSKLTYKWFAKWMENDELKTELIGTNKELEITTNLIDKKINCDVDYYQADDKEELK